MKKNTIPYRLSNETLSFLRRINENAYNYGKISYGEISLDKLLKAVYTYFKLNNDRYLELLEIVGKMEEQKNGS